MNPLRLAIVVGLLGALAFVPLAQGQLLLSSNDNKVTLVNGTATVVKGPPADTLTLVANRAEGTVSIFTIQGKTVTPAGKVTVADEKSGTCHAAISPDGKLALVTRDGDDRISVLSIDGTKVEYTKRDISAGLRP